MASGTDALPGLPETGACSMAITGHPRARRDAGRALGDGEVARRTSRPRTSGARDTPTALTPGIGHPGWVHIKEMNVATTQQD